MSTSINNKFDIVYFFDWCSILSNSLVDAATFAAILRYPLCGFNNHEYFKNALYQEKSHTARNW